MHRDFYNLRKVDTHVTSFKILYKFIVDSSFSMHESKISSSLHDK